MTALLLIRNQQQKAMRLELAQYLFARRSK